MKIEAKCCEVCSRILSKDKYCCPNCYSEEFTVKELQGYGTVYSYTKIHVGTKELKAIAPYYIVLVDLEEGLRLTGRYDGNNLKIGDKVKMEEEVEGAYVFV